MVYLNRLFISLLSKWRTLLDWNRFSWNILSRLGIMVNLGIWHYLLSDWWSLVVSIGFLVIILPILWTLIELRHWPDLLSNWWSLGLSCNILTWWCSVFLSWNMLSEWGIGLCHGLWVSCLDLILSWCVSWVIWSWWNLFLSFITSSVEFHLAGELPLGERLLSSTQLSWRVLVLNSYEFWEFVLNLWLVFRSIRVITLAIWISLELVISSLNRCIVRVFSWWSNNWR